ncbi:MAG TPA: hypothetical protein VIJ22_06220 [Polyangiaceae bacterium]
MPLPSPSWSLGCQDLLVVLEAELRIGLPDEDCYGAHPGASKLSRTSPVYCGT